MIKLNFLFGLLNRALLYKSIKDTKNNYKKLENELEALKQENIETEKAWGESVSRNISITFFAYFIIVILFFSARLPAPFLSSIFPSLGISFSLFMFPFIKKYWIRNIYNK